MPPTLTNDTDGSLSAIAALANDPTKSFDKETALEIEGANIEGSMQEAVQKHLDEVRNEAKESDSPADDKTTEETKTPDKAEDEVSTEKEELDPDKSKETPEQTKAKQDAENARFDSHPRFQELNNRVKELTPLAEEARIDRDFCQQWNIPAEQKATAMNLCRLLNTDPDKALEQLEKVVENIKLNTGKLLPADLAKEVQDGVITQARATELHMARVQLAAKDQLAVKSQESAEKSFIRNREQAQDRWSAQTRAKDPDFKPKEAGQPDGKFELFIKFGRLAMVETPPKTIQDAVDLCEAAYKEAHRLSTRVSTVPRARRNLASDSRSSTTETSPEPLPNETMLAFVARTAGKRHGMSMEKAA